MQHEYREGEVDIKAGSSLNRGVSYAKVLVGGLKSIKSIKGVQGLQQGTTGFNVVKSNDWKGLSFSVPREDMKWLEGSYVGTMYSLEK